MVGDCLDDIKIHNMINRKHFCLAPGLLIRTRTSWGGKILLYLLSGLQESQEYEVGGRHSGTWGSTVKRKCFTKKVKQQIMREE